MEQPCHIPALDRNRSERSHDAALLSAAMPGPPPQPGGHLQPLLLTQTFQLCQGIGEMKNPPTIACVRPSALRRTACSATGNFSLLPDCGRSGPGGSCTRHRGGRGNLGFQEQHGYQVGGDREFGRGECSRGICGRGLGWNWRPSAGWRHQLQEFPEIQVSDANELPADSATGQPLPTDAPR
jgi:hypothetical protein